MYNVQLVVLHNFITHMWQSQVENVHYNQLSLLVLYPENGVQELVYILQKQGSYYTQHLSIVWGSMSKLQPWKVVVF